MMKTALFALLAAIAPVAAIAPAHAADVAVTYKDLDLSTDQGKAKLARRLDVAAREACGMGATRTGTRMPSRDAADCYKQAQVQAKSSMAAILEGAARGG